MSEEMKKDLTMLGYPSEAWIIVSPEVVKTSEDFPGHQNNFYNIFNRKIAKKYDKGSKIAKIDWLEEHQIDYVEKTDTETIEVEAKEVKAPMEVVKEKIEEIVDKSGVPTDNVIIGSAPPPPEETATVDEVKKALEDAGLPPADAIVGAKDGPLLNAVGVAAIWEERVKLLEKYEFFSEDGGTLYKNEKGSEFETEHWGSIPEGLFKSKLSTARTLHILSKKEAEKVETPESSNSIEARIEKSKELEKEVSKDFPKDEVQEAIEEMKKTPDSKAVTKTKETVEKAVDKVIEEGTVTNIKKEDVKEIISINKEKIVGHFGVVDELMKTLTAFKQTFYAISVVKETINNKDLTPAKKVAAIKAAVKNINVE